MLRKQFEGSLFTFSLSRNTACHLENTLKLRLGSTRSFVLFALISNVIFKCLLAGFKTYFQSRKPIQTFSKNFIFYSKYNFLAFLGKIPFGPPEISVIIEFYLEFLKILPMARLKFFVFACRTQFSCTSYIFNF